MIWSLSGIAELYSQATLYPTGALIQNTVAHWANENTVCWSAPSASAKVSIYSGDSNDLTFNGESGIAGDHYLEYFADASSVHPAQALGFGRYESLAAFTSVNASTDKAKTMLTGKLVAIAYDNDDVVLAATYVQSPRILDALYKTSSDDTNEQTLGVVHNGNNISAKLWAPTAQQVKLKVYNADKNLKSTQDMSVDVATGI